MVTPPNSGNVLSYGTPVHTCSSTPEYLDTKHLVWGQIHAVMLEEMAPFFLGPMPPQGFLSTFLLSLQPSSFQVSMFDSLASLHTSETLKYEIFVSNYITQKFFSIEEKSPY